MEFTDETCEEWSWSAVKPELLLQSQPVVTLSWLRWLAVALTLARVSQPNVPFFTCVKVSFEQRRGC